VQICPNCGEENPDRFPLCGFCGTKLAPEIAQEEVRKTVSVIFTDLKGSTSLGERLDPEALREVLSRYFNEMKSVLERHGASIEKYIGDAIVAVFGLPRIREDDALRAVRAAVEMQAALAGLNDELEATWRVRLENRTGVNTGEVVAGEIHAGQHLVTGDVMNTAARLEQNAPTDQILISESTLRLVRDAVEVEEVEPLELKGKAERTPAFRLMGVSSLEGVARRTDTPMVGRTEEMDLVAAAMERAFDEQRPQLVTIFGPAGVGKSRFLQEVVSRAGEQATALRGRCLSYGEGITFWPLGEMIREATGTTGDSHDASKTQAELDRLLADAGSGVAERIGAVIGLSDATFPVQETFWAVRTCLETLAHQAPLIAIVEDVHWAEPTFLDLVRFVVDSSSAPILMLCSSRPDLVDHRPEWVEHQERSTTITLEPLTEEESSMVVENLLPNSGLDPVARARIIEAAEGNPLFVEQILSMIVDDGILSQDERGEWTLASDMTGFSIPPGINALLSARLDRLSPTDRSVIERGAVIGQVFFRGAVEHLAPEPIRDQVGASIQSLIAKQLVRPFESYIPGEDAFKFQHALIRDAAYHGLLKRRRAGLHEQFVEWAERADPEGELEFGEIRGYHLEQAFLTSAQLGPIDEHTRGVGIHGAGYLSTAGKRSLARGDMPAAGNLLQRACALLPAEEPTRPRLLLDAGEALIEVGEFILADAALGEARESAEALGQQGLATTAELVRREMHFLTEGEGTEEELLALAAEAIAQLEELGFHEGVARAWRLIWIVHANASRNGEAETAARRAIDAARLAGDAVMERRFLSSLAFAALYGPTPVADAMARCEQILVDAAGDRKSEALTLSVLARLLGMQGEFDRARDLYHQSRASLEELGWKLHAALTSLVSGPLEMSAGDLEAAEAELNRDYETLQKMGERSYISTTAACLAEAKYRQGRYGDADAFCAISQEVSAPDDVASEALWRCVRGKLLAQAGQHDAAEALVREAVTMIMRTDDLNQQGDSLMDLADVLALAGRADEATKVRAEAAALFERKGNVIGAARARGELTPA
jgi:class 3 adenylate cyclase